MKYSAGDKLNRHAMRSATHSLSAQRRMVSLSNWAKWTTFMPWLSSTFRHYTLQLMLT